jgi:group I intron endonuclease
MNKISGIYKIINKTNGKYYIGSSINIKRRWSNHKDMLKRNIHPNSHLQSSWKKYGKDNFEFLIVETISPNLLVEVEQKYLDASFKESRKCYNNNKFSSGGPKLEGGKNPSYKLITDEIKEILFQEYKNFGYMKTKEKAKLLKVGDGKVGCVVMRRLTNEFKNRLGLSLDKLNMTHSIKILNDDVKKNLLSLWLENGWTITRKIVKEKYGIGYKTLMRTIKEFQKMGYKRTKSPQPVGTGCR